MCDKITENILIIMIESNLEKFKINFSYYNKKKLLYIALFILAIRISYLFIFDNTTGDLSFYNKIVNGVMNGCGIGLYSSEGKCTPIVGHFFPGFFYLISIFYKFGIGVKGIVLFISILNFLSCVNLERKFQTRTLLH